jgi:hypothetical protein
VEAIGICRHKEALLQDFSAVIAGRRLAFPDG